MSAAGLTRDGSVAHAAGGHPRPRARRSRLVRGLLTLAGALAATLALGALTSTAGAQGSSPAMCLNSAAEFGRQNAVPEGFGPGGNFTNNVQYGANWREDLNSNERDGRSSSPVHGPCTTSRFGRAIMTFLPTNLGGLFIERIRVWTESDENDMYLKLYAADGTLIAEDDDSGEGYNSLLSMRVDGLPDRFVGEGSSNIPGTPVDWQVADGRGGGGSGNYESLWLEIGTYGPQPSYDSSIRVHVDIDLGAPWGSDLAGSIVPQLGGLPPTGIQMNGFPTAHAARSLRDYGELVVPARFFDANDGNHAATGSEALDRSSGAARRWFLKSPRGGVLYRRYSSLSTHATAAHDGQHMGILGSTNLTMSAKWEDAFRSGDRSRSGQFAAGDGSYTYGMVPVFRHDYDPALAATGDPRAMNDTGLDDDGDDICAENGTERTVISLAALSGAVNQYTTCVPKSRVTIVPPGTSLDKGGRTSSSGGDAGGTHADGSDRLEPVGYLVAQFDDDNDFGIWPIVLDLHGAPHPQPGSALALAAAGSSGPTLQVSGLQEGTASPLHPDNDDASTDWALQILIDDETENMGTTACLTIPAGDISQSTSWSDDMWALDAHLTTLRIPREVSRMRRGTVPPLTEVRNAPPQPPTVGEFWVRELEPWFTGSGGSKVINLNRATSHARNEIYHRHPERRAAHQLTATGFNFVSGRCYVVGVRYMEIHPGTGLPVATGLKLRLQAIAP